MARCELTGKSPTVKNLVSHSNIKTKSRNSPNVQAKKLYSRILGRQVSLKIATTTIRTVESRGGIDVFLLNALDNNLSHRALALKYQLRRRIRGENDGEVKAAVPVKTVEAAEKKAPAAPKKKPAAKKAAPKTAKK
jgi:large subunit ribosomal protein L28